MHTLTACLLGLGTLSRGRHPTQTESSFPRNDTCTLTPCFRPPRLPSPWSVAAPAAALAFAAAQPPTRPTVRAVLCSRCRCVLPAQNIIAPAAAAQQQCCWH